MYKQYSCIYNQFFLSKETNIEACSTSETYKLRSIELTEKYFGIFYSVNLTPLYIVVSLNQQMHTHYEYIQSYSFYKSSNILRSRSAIFRDLKYQDFINQVPKDGAKALEQVEGFIKTTRLCIFVCICRL